MILAWIVLCLLALWLLWTSLSSNRELRLIGAGLSGAFMGVWLGVSLVDFFLGRANEGRGPFYQYDTYSDQTIYVWGVIAIAWLTWSLVVSRFVRDYLSRRKLSAD